MAMFFQRQRSLPWVGLSLMPDPDFLQATQPLFAAGAVEILEWSFDMAWGLTLPDWLEDLLIFYSQQDRLIGHGVSFSLLSAHQSLQQQERQQTWLAFLEEELQTYRYRHLSEHFGWLAAGDFYQSAPLPLPLTPETRKLGRDRLKQLADTAQMSLGLENLAFAFGRQDVLAQGEFIDQLLEAVDGFLVLDLHNLFCQIHNFQLSAIEALARYPLHRVREIHISGGSWSASTQDRRLIRRDTHDDLVPETVFELLSIALKHCPNTEAIILERIGNTFRGPSEMERFRQDFQRVKQIVKTTQFR